MGIPKIIHYCWFGGKPLSKEMEYCIDSWKKYCPDFEIRRWDETNFDVTCHPYMKEAYEAKKWPFVTDLARLLIVYQFGGIYLDTDVEIIKPIDHLLEYEGFMGYEDKKIATGLGFGAKSGNSIVKAMIDDYDGIHFIKPDGSFDTIVCPTRNKNVLMKLGLLGDGSYQIIEGVHFLPPDYLCPMNYKTHKIDNMTDNTLSIHHYNASWRKWYDREKYRYNKGSSFKEYIIYLSAKFIRFLRSLKNNILK